MTKMALRTTPKAVGTQDLFLYSGTRHPDYQNVDVVGFKILDAEPVVTGLKCNEAHTSLRPV